MTIQLIHADCLEVDWPQVDAIITDVPYGVTACKWDSIIPFPEMWKKIKSSLKPRGAFVTTASQPFTSALVMSNPKWFKYEWIWNKNNSAGYASVKYRPFIVSENILVFSKNTHAYYPQMEVRGKIRRKGFGGSKSEVYGSIEPQKGALNNSYYPKNIINISKVNKRENDHPTQKPVALYEYLIKTYTNEGDTVLDFCAGSGTTLQACINTGRNGIGIEKDEKYYNIAKERLGL